MTLQCYTKPGSTLLLKSLIRSFGLVKHKEHVEGNKATLLKARLKIRLASNCNKSAMALRLTIFSLQFTLEASRLSRNMLNNLLRTVIVRGLKGN